MRASLLLIKNRQFNAGFTLIELMIVVAIIGILAAISMPMLANLVAKAQEGSTKGNAGTLRSALAIYYGDVEGQYPTDPNALTVAQRYLTQIPKAYFPKTIYSPGHTPSRGFGVVVAGPLGSLGAILGGQMWFLGNGQPTIGFVALFEGGDYGWFYDGSGSFSATYGLLEPMCSHKDLQSRTWDTY